MVMQHHYRRKTIVETQDNREEIEWVLHRSTEYSRFLATIDPKLYSDKLLRILNELLMAGDGELKGNAVAMLESLADIYTKILVLFRESFSSSLNSEASHQLVSILFGMLKDADMRVSRTVSRALGKLLELFVVLLEREFKLMDDYEFATASYPPPVMRNIIEFLLKHLGRAVLEQERVRDGRPSPHLQYFSELLANIYDKNFRTKLLDPAVFIADVQLNRLFQECRFDERQNGLFKQLENIPFVINLEFRYMKFLESMRDGYVPMHEVNGLVTIQRDSEFISAYNQIGKRSLNGRFQFEFLSQNG